MFLHWRRSTSRTSNKLAHTSLTHTKDGEQNCTNQSGNQENFRETEKPHNSNKEREQRKNNESSAKQIELSHLKEEKNRWKEHLTYYWRGND